MPVPVDGVDADEACDEGRAKVLVAFVVAVDVADELFDLLVTGVRVEMPQVAVVAVGDAKARHPRFLSGVATTSRHQTRDERRRSDVELQPLVSFKQNYFAIRDL